MRRNSPYTTGVRRSRAVWSPPLQAFNNTVISADSGSAMGISHKKVTTTCRFLVLASACTGGGNEHEANCNGDDDGIDAGRVGGRKRRGPADLHSAPQPRTSRPL